MCKTFFIVLLILACTMPCFGQSAFMDYGKSGGAIIATGSYNTYSSLNIPNTGAISFGGSLSFGGRLDVDFSLTHFMGSETTVRLPQGQSLKSDVPGESFSFGTEVFIYKSPGTVRIMLSFGGGMAIGDQIGIEGSPLILSLRTSRNTRSFAVLALAFSYYDADIDEVHHDDSGLAAAGQFLVFVAKTDNTAFAFGPSYAINQAGKSLSFTFSVLFI